MTAATEPTTQTATELVHELIAASYEVSHKETRKAGKRQDQAAAAVLTAMLGRKPTKDELKAAVYA